MRVAVVHEWLTTFAGSEKALAQILKVFPNADLFCLIDFLPESQRQLLEGRRARTSFLQYLPTIEKNYRNYLPLMPLAIRQYDLREYDLVISSSHAVANGVITRTGQLHVSYTYSPMRYAWDLRDQYLQESGLDAGIKGLFAGAMLSYLKKWDYRASRRVGYFIAISEYIRDRIKNSYGRDAYVIYPPVDTDFFQMGDAKGEFYLAASRMVPYKMMPLIVSAFSEMPHRKLVVIGDGPELDRVKACAGENVEILGYQNDRVLREYLQRAKALVFAAEEDFGILPVEAQSCGTPVIGYGKGGLLETVNGLGHEVPTGVLFNEQNVPAIKKAINDFEANIENFSPLECRNNALRFSETNFRMHFEQYVCSLLHAKRSGIEPD
jgi:glycosyltransferase involved in cell wall biosynthesis